MNPLALLLAGSSFLPASSLLAQSSARNTKGSPPIFIFYMIGGVVVLVILATILAKRADAKRRVSVRAALENRGLTHHDQGPPVRAPYELVLAPIQALASRASKTLWSAGGVIDGVEFIALEHHYSTGAGKNRQVHNHSVVSIPVPETWPKLDVYAENLFHKIGEFFGSKDLKVDDEAFNKRFRVKGPSEDFVLLFLTPEIQRLMLNWPKGTTLALGNGRLCVSRSAHLDAAHWPALIDEAVALRNALPKELEAWA